MSDKATAALIDADSFQVSEGAKQHLCKVGVPEYTPPELQGQRLDRVARTSNHDAFGLAVMIFQLLWMGRHPFAGRYRQGEMPLEKAIAEFRFAYSKARNVGMEPPPAVPGLADFPPQLAAAFEQAFGPDGPKARPSAKQWIALLKELEESLRTCAAHSLHHYPATGSECPWCRMEKLQGVQLFVPFSNAFATDPSANLGTVSGDLEAIWRAIEAVQPPPAGPHTPFVHTVNPEPTEAAKGAKTQPWKRKLWGLAALKAEIEGLPAKEHERIQAYAANRRAEHLRVHLEKFQLRRFKIAGIGPSKEATLRSYGIETAADVTPTAVLRVPGFGPVTSRPLLEWRRRHEATFNYVVTPTAADRAAITSIKNEFAKRGVDLKAKLATGPAALKKVVAETRQKLTAVDPTLQGLHEQRMQAAADLTFLGLSMPPVSFTPKPTPRPNSATTFGNNYRPNPIPPPLRAPAGGQGATCPMCGGGMVLRTARKGKRPGSRFYGCSRYPSCRGTRPGP